MKILLADDHMLVREGLKPFLAGLARKVQFVEAWDAASLMAAVLAHADLDLVLVDLHMPGMQGVQSIARLRDESPALPVVVLSGVEIADQIEAVLHAGASGYIPKSSGADVMVSALRLVLAGGQYLPPLLLAPTPVKPIAAATRPHVQAVPAHTAKPARLTTRQREVVDLVARGLSNKMIAHELGMLEGTVKSHLVQIFHLLGVRNRTSAVVAAQRLIAKQAGPDDHA